MKSVLFIIISALILSANSFVECQTNDKDPEITKTPRDSFDLGPFTVEAFYNETNSKEKLTLNKSYFKVRVVDKKDPDSSYLSMKVARREELMRCDNLTLESYESQQILDCLPIEAFLTDRDYASSTSGGYVRRSSVRVKPKLPKYIPQTLQEYRVYPIASEHVEKSISNIVEFHNLSNLDFTPLKVNLGYYFEVSAKQHRDEVNPLVCTCKVFLSVNRTRILARYRNDPFPEYVDEFSHFIEQGRQNGYLLSVQDVSCTKSGYASIFALTGSFTIIQQLKFPYLIVRHTMGASPITVIFNYVATVDQTLVPEKGPSAYNTTVRIKSRSGLMDLMNFDLNQVFENEDLENGIEAMKMIHATYGVALVNSVWNGDGLQKAISLLSMDVAKLASDTGNGLEEKIKLELSNKKADDYLLLALKVKKNLIDPLLRNPLDQFLDLIDPEGQEPLTTGEKESTSTKEPASIENNQIKDEL